MIEPSFKNGEYTITDNQGNELTLSERTWLQHIIKDRGRGYFKSQFSKIVQTVKAPDRIIRSKAEKNVVIYERFFDDFYITNTVLGRVYISVFANWKTKRIRTVHTSPRKRKKGEIIWEAQSSK